MTTAFVLSLLLASTMIFVAAGSPPPPVTENCSDELISFSPCLSYVSVAPNNFTTTAGSQCCDSLALAINSGKEKCLCFLYNQPMFLGFPLNESRVLSLPIVCSLRNANMTTSEPLNSLCSSGALTSFGNSTDSDFFNPSDPSDPVPRNFTSTHLPPDVTTAGSPPALPNARKGPDRSSSSTHLIYIANAYLLFGVLRILALFA